MEVLNCQENLLKNTGGDSLRVETQFMDHIEHLTIPYKLHNSIYFTLERVNIQFVYFDNVLMLKFFMISKFFFYLRKDLVKKK